MSVYGANYGGNGRYRPLDEEVLFLLANRLSVLIDDNNTFPAWVVTFMPYYNSTVRTDSRLKVESLNRLRQLAHPDKLKAIDLLLHQSDQPYDVILDLLFGRLEL